MPLKRGAISGGNGTTPNRTFFKYKAAALEPLAIEPLQYGTFNYTVTVGSPKIAMATYDTRLGDADSYLEVRNPARWQALSGVTMEGRGSAAAAIFADPGVPTYSDAESTFYSRMNSLMTMQQKYIGFSAANTNYMFLPGPYGAIILDVTNNGYAWTILGNNNFNNNLNLWNEKGNLATDQFNYSNQMFMPVSKLVGCGIQTGQHASINQLGGVLFVQLPPSWGAVADPVGSYTFRDDFMGGSLDTVTNWTRTQGASGNIEINTTHQWCQVLGNQLWSTNGAFSKVGVSAQSGRILLVDYMATNGSQSTAFGFSDGSGPSYTNLAYAFLPNSSGVNVYENGVSRGVVGSWDAWTIYRMRITVQGSLNAKYEMQGGKQYAGLGGASWSNITPGSSNSSTGTLHFGMAAFGTYGAWLGDARMYG